MSGRPRAALIALVAVLLAMTLGGQALTDSLAVGASGADTTEAVGRAASSYLTGIRTFGAAVLWNRLDPLFHNYYGGMSLADQRYMLSTIAIVEALDPELVEPYYIGAWVLVQNDRVDEGLTMAVQGVQENPTVGMLHANLAQIQFLYADDLDGALETSEAGIGADIEWTSASEQFNGYTIFRDVFKAAGRDDLYSTMVSEISRLDAEIEADPGEQDHDHDHDHDGVPDH